MFHTHKLRKLIRQCAFKSWKNPRRRRNIYQGVFITLAWDNIDRSEETTSGDGTSHRVNAIQTLNIMESLGLKESVCVFDQVFYVKTADITWKHDKFKNIIFRMVAFHTIPFETSHIDRREGVSGCWPPRLVCGVWQDFRRIDH